MDEAFHYTDPRGRRSGPFSRAELRTLADRGLLEPEGTIDDGSGLASWRVGDLGWHGVAGSKHEVPAGIPPEHPAAPPDGGTPAPSPSISPPPTDPAAAPTENDPDRVAAMADPLAAAARTAPPTNPDDPAVRRVDPPTMSTLSRTAYVLLAVLLIPFFAFGVHNLAAGYIGRGVVQLLLGLVSLATVAAGGWFPPLCCCFGGLLYAALALWSVIDAITMTRDARGLRLA